MISVINFFVAKRGKNMKDLLNLFFVFFKISLITFGGGYTCLPIMEKELVTKRKIITSEELLSNYAIAQMMPGLITINVGVLIGYKKDKLPGVVAIMLGTVIPPLVIGVIISALLNKYMHLDVFANIFWGIRAGVAVLIFTVIYKLIAVMGKTLKNIFTILSSFSLYYFFNLQPVYVILLTISVFILIEFIESKKIKED